MDDLRSVQEEIQIEEARACLLESSSFTYQTAQATGKNKPALAAPNAPRPRLRAPNAVRTASARIPLNRSASAM